ncbi:hypothetical protein [Pseudomonas sp. PDM30]|uniref:hypothetical protein n=1 Tax=Pseudomonas sp. PDM30 TaxID=2854773 RepID=UPI001C48FD04|nr:hypothetical protein [Pseudomonas sp. PDM30]MBV7489818.1 hypothetical protein [Pseudomonas sp. PDM30]
MTRSHIFEKMVERTLWVLWFLLMGGAVLWLLVGSVAYWVKHGWLPPDAAGWVQAIGAVLAIAIAVAVPMYQKFHERSVRAEDMKRLEVARSQQLLCMCTEAYRFIDLGPEEEAYADFHVTNEMRRTILSDQLARLTDIQKGELNPERMEIGLKLRFELHDWMKYFGGEKSPAIGHLYSRVERHLPDLKRVKINAENELRKLEGRPLIKIPKHLPEVHDELY